MRGTACLLTALLLLAAAPTALAGTADAPEVTDPGGDGYPCANFPVAACPPGPASQAFLDVLKVWVEEAGPDAFQVHLALAGAPPAFGPGAGAPIPMFGCQGVGSSVYYEVDFQALDPSGSQTDASDPGGFGDKLNDYLSATVACDTAASMSPTAIEFDHGILTSTTTGDTIELLGQVAGQVTGSDITWTVPRDLEEIAVPAGAAAAGYSLGSLSARSEMLVQQVGTFFADRAPDADFGTPFAFGSSSAAKPIYGNVTTPDFSLVAKNPTATNLTYIYNWTASKGDLDLSYNVAASAGSAHVTVRDSGNATVFNKTLSGNDSGAQRINPAKTGAWQVTVSYTDFTGNLTLGIATHEASSSATTSSSASGTTSGHSSSSSSGTTSHSSSSSSSAAAKKKSPGVEFVPLGLGLLAVGVALRRRLPPN